MIDFLSIIKNNKNYNFHSHTQFCDGRNTMEDICLAAKDNGIKYLGFTPHSPLNIYSPCNMKWENVPEYFEEIGRLQNVFGNEMEIYKSMEIDYLSPDFGAHIDYFQNLPLDYRLSSVHFVPTKKGELIDCDGSEERFKKNLDLYFQNDIRYVVEKYFEQVLCMAEKGGFEIIGHFDKIACNASYISPGIENENWYEALVNDIISHIIDGNYIVEINTKAFEKKQRFYPSEKWWKKLLERNLPLMINSDVHYKDKIQSGRNEAFDLISKLK